MDAVSEILLAREQGAPRIGPWVSVAAALHLALVGVAFVMARNGASRPAQMPAVTVRLVQPAARPTGGAGAPAGRPAATPIAQATPAPPRPTAVPKPTRSAATPAPVPSKAPARASDTALADPAASATRPAATAAATTGSGGDGSGGGSPASGLSIGGAGGGGAAAGVPSDFQFTYYLDRMLGLIESHWFKPSVAAGTRSQVGFRIMANGRIEAVQLELSSGNPSFDRAVLRAIYAANPLPPLPPAYLKPSLTIHLTFAE